MRRVPLALAYNAEFAPHELNRLMRIVKGNRVWFLEAWHEFFRA
jgi:hypothetical protein